MQKDFMTITPDFGEGAQEVTVAVPANTGDARSSTIKVSAEGMTRTVTVNQKAANKELVDGTYWGEADDSNTQQHVERVEFTVSDGVKSFTIDLNQDPLPIAPNGEQDRLLYVMFDLISDTECTNVFLETEKHSEIQNDDGCPIQVTRKASMVEITMSPIFNAEAYNELTFYLYL